MAVGGRQGTAGCPAVNFRWSHRLMQAHLGSKLCEQHSLEVLVASHGVRRAPDAAQLVARPLQSKGVAVLHNGSEYMNMLWCADAQASSELLFCSALCNAVLACWALLSG